MRMRYNVSTSSLLALSRSSGSPDGRMSSKLVVELFSVAEADEADEAVLVPLTLNGL